MKKMMIALAIAALATAAQAELLATWNQVGGAVTQEAVTGLDEVTALGVYGNAKQTSPSSIFGVNTLTDGASGIAFLASADSGYEIVGASLQASYTGSATGPGVLNFLVNSSAVTSFTRSGQSGSFDVTLGDLGNIAEVAIVADLAGGTARSGTNEKFSNAAGSFVIRTGMTLNGTVQKAAPAAVPEPATMSLLGLGALAMVIRRKLRK